MKNGVYVQHRHNCRTTVTVNPWLPFIVSFRNRSKLPRPSRSATMASTKDPFCTVARTHQGRSLFNPDWVKWPFCCPLYFLSLIAERSEFRWLRRSSATHFLLRFTPPDNFLVKLLAQVKASKFTKIFKDVMWLRDYARRTSFFLCKQGKLSCSRGRNPQPKEHVKHDVATIMGV